MRKLILTTLLCAASAAFANQDTTTSALEFTREEAQVAPQGLLPFLGLGGGYTGYDTVGSVEGTPATLKLLGSYYFSSPFVADLGYGVNNQQFSQATDSVNDRAITDGALEIAARYRWEKWQAGVVANHLFNQGAAFTADQGDAQFVGLQALRQFNISSSWLARLGARAQALTNNTDGNVTMYMVDLQLGWNPGAYKPSVRQSAENPVEREPMSVASDSEIEETSFTETEAPTTIAPTRPIAEVRPESALRDVSYASLAGGTSIQFQTAQANPSAEDQQKLNQLSQVLADNSDLFDRVEIHGYTDSTGSSTINQRISQQRANSVASILKRNGVNDVVAVGKGSSDSTGSMASDRRAELVFIGVKDEAKLQEALSQIQ